MADEKRTPIGCYYNYHLSMMIMIMIIVVVAEVMVTAEQWITFHSVDGPIHQFVAVVVESDPLMFPQWCGRLCRHCYLHCFLRFVPPVNPACPVLAMHQSRQSHLELFRQLRRSYCPYLCQFRLAGSPPECLRDCWLLPQSEYAVPR